MVMSGEVGLFNQSLQMEAQDQYQTSFINFYGSLLKTPFLGDQYNYILPGLMLLLCLIFLLLNCAKYEQRIVAFLRRYNSHRDRVSDTNIETPLN